MNQKPSGTAVAILVTLVFVIAAIVLSSIAERPENPDCDPSQRFCIEP